MDIKLNEEKVVLMRELLNIDDIDVIRKIKKLLHHETHKVKATSQTEEDPTTVAEEAPPYLTKAEILANIDEACKELKQNIEGKLDFIPLEDALDEL